MPDPHSGSSSLKPPIDDALAEVRQMLERIRFGSIALTIHEGRIVQLDVTEKRRLTA
jgi:hypothetical protein